MKFLLTSDVSGPVNLTGPDPVTNAEVTLQTAVAVRDRVLNEKASILVRDAQLDDEPPLVHRLRRVERLAGDHLEGVRRRAPGEGAAAPADRDLIV